jgi:hypothetical protein
MALVSGLCSKVYSIDKCDNVYVCNYDHFIGFASTANFQECVHWRNSSSMWGLRCRLSESEEADTLPHRGGTITVAENGTQRATSAVHRSLGASRYQLTASWHPFALVLWNLYGVDGKLRDWGWMAMLM